MLKHPPDQATFKLKPGYRTIPIPLTRYTAAAAIGLLLLLLAGRWFAALCWLIGWSLGGDGQVFKHALGMFREWRKTRTARADVSSDDGE